VSDKRRGLGRGLGALIPNGPAASPRPQHADAFGAVPTRTAGRPVDVFFDQRTEPADEPAPVVEEPTVREDPTTTAAEAPATPHEEVPVAPVQPDGLVAVPGARFAEVPVTSIVPNPRQPRTVFDEDELAELVHSVQEIGVLQPIVVRAVPGVEGEPETYELVMGERRWRAATEAGLATVPAIVRETADDDLLRDALLENLHRSQLNPLEEAAAYQQLLEDFGCTHEDLAGRIGRSRPQISNTLRLLKLPPLVQRRVAAGVLSAGHARALLSLEDGGAMERLAQRIVAEGLSVRAVEEIIALGDADTAPRRRNPPQPQPEVERRASALAERLDTRVRIAVGRTKGRLTVDFAGLDDLDRILSLLEQQPTRV